MTTTAILWVIIIVLAALLMVATSIIVDKNLIISNLRAFLEQKAKDFKELKEKADDLDYNYQLLVEKYENYLKEVKELKGESEKKDKKIDSLKEFCNKLHREKLDLIRQAKCKRFNPKEATTTTEIRDYIIGLYENGCSYREIADITGFKKNTINKAILKWKNQGLVGPVIVNNYENLDK